jgi:hypothetical protein
MNRSAQAIAASINEWLLQRIREEAETVEDAKEMLDLVHEKVKADIVGIEAASRTGRRW